MHCASPRVHMSFFLLVQPLVCIKLNVSRPLSLSLSLSTACRLRPAEFPSGETEGEATADRQQVLLWWNHLSCPFWGTVLWCAITRPRKDCVRKHYLPCTMGTHWPYLLRLVLLCWCFFFFLTSQRRSDAEAMRLTPCPLLVGVGNTRGVLFFTVWLMICVPAPV